MSVNSVTYLALLLFGKFYCQWIFYQNEETYTSQQMNMKMNETLNVGQSSSGLFTIETLLEDIVNHARKKIWQQVEFSFTSVKFVFPC